MVDYIKAVAKNTGLYGSHSSLLFESSFDIQTGEISNFKVANYKGLNIRVYESGFLIVKGSLHKFWNSGSHNADDFHFEHLLEAIENLSIVLGLPVSSMELQNLEVGYNLSVADSKAAVDGFFLHNAVVPEARFNGHYKEFRHSDYSIKIYSKSYQYDLKEEVLRCEIKMVKSRYFNRFGVYTVEDLCDRDNLSLIKDDLLKQLGKTIACYPLPVTQISSDIWSNPYYWAELDKRKRYSEKKLFEDWKGTQLTKWTPLDRLIDEKFQDLTS